MKHPVFRGAVLLLLAVCLLFSGVSGAAADEKAKKEINVAGVKLLTYTPYTVYLEPTAVCSPTFEPVYVTMEFQTVNSCTLTYQGRQVSMARLDNKKYIDLVSRTDAAEDTLMLNGTCDTNCTGADFAVRVTDFIQGENAPPVFSADAVLPEAWTMPPEPIVPDEPPATFRAGSLTLTEGVRYTFRVVPDESCDKDFDPFTIPIQFTSQFGGYFVTSQYKNVSSVYPFSLFMHDSGWLEFFSNTGKFWGTLTSGGADADFLFRVEGLEKNYAGLFHNITLRKGTEPEPEPQPELPIASYNTEFYYYYGLLNEGEKSVYTQIVQGLTACEETITLAYPVSNADFNRINWYVLYDQPQLFWTNYPGKVLKRTNDGLASTVKLSYNDLAGNLSREQSRVEDAVSKILSKVKGMNAQDAERVIHDLIVKETTYVSQSPHDQDIYSVLVNGESVCAGYSHTFQYLMQRLGIPCYYCCGNVPDSGSIYEGRHAWNLIRINNDWYNIDVTWDDFYKETNKPYSCISYEYYNVTDAFISGEHTRNENGSKLPACNSSRASFDNLYGHNWQTEIALANGVPAVSTLNEYFTLCYNQLMKNGIGDTPCRFIVTNRATYDRIAEQYKTKEYEKAYVYPFFDAKKLKNVVYTYRWQSTTGVGSRGNCYYVDITHIVTRK